jgi:hypothetical protein
VQAKADTIAMILIRVRIAELIAILDILFCLNDLLNLCFFEAEAMTLYMQMNREAVTSLPPFPVFEEAILYTFSNRHTFILEKDLVADFREGDVYVDKVNFFLNVSIMNLNPHLNRPRLMMCFYVFTS